MFLGINSNAGKAAFLQDSLKVVAAVLAYFFCQTVSFTFPDTKNVFMEIWPAAGVGLAALLLCPRRLWPILLVGLFVSGNAANLIDHRPLLSSLGFMTANVCESFASAWLITRICGEGVKFEYIREVLALIAAATLVNACSACIGAGVAAWTTGAGFWHFWLSWWIVDGLGLLIITPFIVLCSDYRKCLPRLSWIRSAEFIGFMAFWGVLSAIPFNPGAIPGCRYVFPYMLIAVIIWPAFRWGQLTVTIAVILQACMVVLSPAVVNGPLLWGGVTFGERLLLAQLYVGFIAAFGMILAAVYFEFKQAARYAVELAAEKAAAQTAREKAAEIFAAHERLRKAQEYLVQTEKLAAIGTLSAGVAHELNSPLTGILELSRFYLTHKDPQGREYQDLEKIVEAAERMAKIIKGLRDFSRPASRELEYLNCRDLVEGMLDFCKSIIRNSEVQVRKDFEKDLPAVRGDKVQLQQIIDNLIRNALDSMPKQGILEVSARMLTAENRRFIEMEFKDNGSGIRKEDLPKIFDPFFTTKVQGKGTGLGLWVVYSIIKQHDGEIFVESPPAGQAAGTSFKVRIPAVS